MLSGQNLRLIKGICAGLVSAIVVGTGYGFLIRFLPLELEVLVLGVGYLVGYSIKSYGRGVKPIFSTIGVVCTILAFFISEIVAGYLYGISGFTNNFYFALENLLSINSFWSVIGLMFRLGALSLAYNESRIV